MDLPVSSSTADAFFRPETHSEDISMKASKTLLTLGLALVGAAFNFGLAVRAQAQTVTYLAEFSASYARSVIQATDGNFYGTTFAGGAHDKGQVFRMTPGGELS